MKYYLGPNMAKLCIENGLARAEDVVITKPISMPYEQQRPQYHKPSKHAKGKR